MANALQGLLLPETTPTTGCEPLAHKADVASYDVHLHTVEAHTIMSTTWVQRQVTSYLDHRLQDIKTYSQFYLQRFKTEGRL
jgi:hypothetical protein